MISGIGSGILGFFSLATIVMIVGVILEEVRDIDPIGFYQITGVLVLVGIVLIVKQNGGLGAFGIKI